MENDDDNYDLCKDNHDLSGFSTVCHVQKNAEDVQRQEGNDAFGNYLVNDVLEFIEDMLGSAQVAVGDAQSHDE